MAYLLSNELTTAVICARQQQAVAAASPRTPQSVPWATTRVTSAGARQYDPVWTGVTQRSYSRRSGQRYV